MRRCALLLFAAATVVRAQSGSVEGVVINKTGGQPLRGVHVHLLTGMFEDGGGINAAFAATSDAAGHFKIAGLSSGLYLMLAEGPGYIQVPASTKSPLPFTMITLKPAEHRADLKVEMVARATISGRVMDEFGDPVEGASLSLEPVPPARPQEGLFGNGNNTSDDRGEFRMTTAPGKYYLHASVNRRGTPPEIRTDGTSGAPFAGTYFPSAANTAGASPIEVGAGQDVAGIEVRLRRESASSPTGRALTISGVVTGIPEGGTVEVTARYGEAADQLHNSRNMFVGPDGKFNLSGLSPGFCSVSARVYTSKPPLYSRPVEFQLAADTTGLTLSLIPAEELTGTLEIAGAPPSGTPVKSRVQLLSRGGSTPAAGEVAADGTFRVSGIIPGKFRVQVSPLPADTYLKSIAFDGKTVANDEIDLSQGVGRSRLKITLSTGGTQLSGRVLGKDGEPVVGMAMVFLAASEKELSEAGGDNRAVAGKYSLKAIRPGKYRLFAIDVFELLPLIDNADQDETMKTFFEAGEEIEIKEGDRIVKDIRAITGMPEKKGGK